MAGSNLHSSELRSHSGGQEAAQRKTTVADYSCELCSLSGRPQSKTTAASFAGTVDSEEMEMLDAWEERDRVKK